MLPFTPQSVPSYTDIVARRRAAGRPIAQFDAQIAATARSAGLRPVSFTLLSLPTNREVHI